MLNSICSKCEKICDHLMKGEILEDSEDNFIWYCEDCVKNHIRPAHTTRITDSCQWCKLPLEYKERLPFDVVMLHLECYDKILEIGVN